MAAAAESEAGTWVEHARSALKRSGHRASGPRLAVLDVLARERCLLTAREIDEELRREGREAGLATVYRTLELLDELRLVQRVEMGEGTARYEPAGPSGEHHHHLVCERCGRVSPFSDEGLERAIARVARRVEHRVLGHDVVLRGACPCCAAAAS
jgi:Fur family transcriptional regulator, ferric uptake regulator